MAQCRNWPAAVALRGGTWITRWHGGCANRVVVQRHELRTAGPRLATPMLCGLSPDHHPHRQFCYLTIMRGSLIIPATTKYAALIQRGGGTGPTKPRQPWNEFKV